MYLLIFELSAENFVNCSLIVHASVYGLMYLTTIDCFILSLVDLIVFTVHDVDIIGQICTH